MFRLLCRSEQNVHLRLHFRERFLDAVEYEQVRNSLDRVENVVERGREGVNVLAVDRCDERRVEPTDDRVCDLVALMLALLDPLGLRLHVLVILDEVLQQFGRRHEVLGRLLEQVEELSRALGDPELHV